MDKLEYYRNTIKERKRHCRFPTAIHGRDTAVPFPGCG